MQSQNAMRISLQKQKKRTKGKGNIACKAKKPGDFVSVDTTVSRIPGYIPFSVGRPSNRRYIGSNLWVDHHTKFLWTNHHKAANAKTVVLSKIKFESFAKRYNVDVKHVHNDNGVFASKAFIDNCDSSLQKHTLCGVGSILTEWLSQAIYWCSNRQSKNYATPRDAILEQSNPSYILAFCNFICQNSSQQHVLSRRTTMSNRALYR